MLRWITIFGQLSIFYINIKKIKKTFLFNKIYKCIYWKKNKFSQIFIIQIFLNFNFYHSKNININKKNVSRIINPYKIKKKKKFIINYKKVQRKILKFPNFKINLSLLLKQCFADCPARYFQSNNKCYKCHPSCKSCFGAEENNCITCETNYFFNKN
jgi:hypothetical protein